MDVFSPSAAEDVTRSADYGSASLAATSEAAGAGWDPTEPPAGNRLSRLLLSAAFTLLFFFILFSLGRVDASGHGIISGRCNTRFVGFFSLSLSRNEEGKKKKRLEAN